jgi:hypothetical protein
MILKHPYNTLFEYDGTLSIELSYMAKQQIMSIINPKNEILPDWDVKGMNVKSITFDGEIGED